MFISYLLCARIFGPLEFFQQKPIFKYIYLLKLVSTEQFWSTIYTNTLLKQLWSQYKLWTFKIHFPSPTYLFLFVKKFLASSREQCFSCIHKNNYWYLHCVIEYRLIVAYFWKWTTLIGSFEFTRAQIF